MNVEPIGFVSSCFREKFGIPRQARLARAAAATLRLDGGPFADPSFAREAVRGLERFSHVWLIYRFHAAMDPKRPPRSTVRPPRLGGKERVGVLASRSPHRPNAIGISAVELKEVRVTRSSVTLHLGGVDLLDGTPILDVKPYVAYADSIPKARSGWLDEASISHAARVTFTRGALSDLRRLYLNQPAELRAARDLISQTLRLDPRSRAQKSKKTFAAKLLNFDVKWETTESGDQTAFRVTSIAEIQA